VKRSGNTDLPFIEVSKPIEEGSMRRLVFGTVLLAIASVGSYALITASLAAARDAKAATFSERFAAAYK
jgi:hypothetical protein